MTWTSNDMQIKDSWCPARSTHTCTCSIHHFKGKILNINIFTISHQIFFTLPLDFEQNAAMVIFRSKTKIYIFVFWPQNPFYMIVKGLMNNPAKFH